MQPFRGWVTPWMSFISSMIVLRMLSLNAYGETSGLASESNSELPTKLPCPDPSVISPCECAFSEESGMDMDCSNVTSENELRRVFSNDFAFTNFRKLIINNNSHIQSLRDGDLGSASFTEISIYYTSLKEIEDSALTGSLYTLVTLDVSSSKLIFVPEIMAFTKLENLRIWDNEIFQIQALASETLLRLDLGRNNIEEVPEDTITNLPSLELLDLYDNYLTLLNSYTFAQNGKLEDLNLGANRLTTIPPIAISLHGENTHLNIQKNQITSLTYEAVSSVTGYLDVSHNNLTKLPEEVFRPLLEDSVDVYLSANPFKCGCDVAWLICNQTLLQTLPDLDTVTCSDGESFSDLDPEVYEKMCPNVTAVPM